MQTMTHTNEQIIAYLQGKLTPQERATLLEEAQHDEALRKGLNIVNGKVTYKAVADVYGLAYTPI